MRKLYLLLLFLFILPTAIAQNLYPVGVLDYKTICTNQSQFCPTETQCNITIIEPDHNILVNNQLMTNQSYFYNYTINLTKTGTYNAIHLCHNGGTYIEGNTEFEVTPLGIPAGNDIMIVAIYTLFILSMIAVLYTGLMNLINLLTYDQTYYALLASWGSYIMLIIVSYLAGAYLLEGYITRLTDTILTATRWTNGVLPVIAIFVTIMIRIIKGRKLTAIDTMWRKK